MTPEHAELCERLNLLAGEHEAQTWTPFSDAAAAILALSAERDELIHDVERHIVIAGECEARAGTLNAAIQYAIKRHGGIYWLAEWNAGDPDAMAELARAALGEKP